MRSGRTTGSSPMGKTICVSLDQQLLTMTAQLTVTTLRLFASLRSGAQEYHRRTTEQTCERVV